MSRLLEPIKVWWDENWMQTAFALLCITFGLWWCGDDPPLTKERPIEPVTFLPQQHVMVHDVGGSGRSAKIELVGMTPTMIPSPIIGVPPRPKMEGTIYVFSGHALQLRDGPPDKITLQVAGAITKTVILEVPERIPVFFGKKGVDPPRKK